MCDVPGALEPGQRGRGEGLRGGRGGERGGCAQADLRDRRGHVVWFGGLGCWDYVCGLERGRTEKEGKCVVGRVDGSGCLVGFGHEWVSIEGS